MKQCPQCGYRNDEENDFCVVDGAPLGDSGRVVVDLDPKVATQVVPTSATAPSRTAAQPATRPGFIYGVIGALAAAVVLLGGYVLILSNRAIETSTATPQASQSPLPGANGIENPDSKSTAPNASPVTNLAADTITNVAQAANRQIELSANRRVGKRSYNGRVIMLNAIIRSAPSIYAPEIAVAPFSEPLKIGKSAGGNNPWYRVTTSAGTTGWMHGNTIEFVR